MGGGLEGSWEGRAVKDYWGSDCEGPLECKLRVGRAFISAVWFIAGLCAYKMLRHTVNPPAQYLLGE